MDTFKQFYLQNNEPVNEGLRDLLGDMVQGAGKAIKKGANAALSQGTKDVIGRLFNVENDIIKLLNAKEYRALGKLLIEKKIPQNFAFKRIKLFGNNAEFGAATKTYNDVPLFFGLTALLVDKGEAANLTKIYAEIASAGIALKYYLNRINPEHKDIISFIMLAPNHPAISKANQTPTAYEKICASIIKTLLTYGYDSTLTDNLAVHTAIRMESLAILKAFFEGKYKVKLTAEIEQEADQVDNQDIIKYIEAFKTGKPVVATTDKQGTATNITTEFAKFGYDPKNIANQKIKQADAVALLQELAIAVKTPYDKAKLDSIAKNKSQLKTALIAKLQALKLPAAIEIV